MISVVCQTLMVMLTFGQDGDACSPRIVPDRYGRLLGILTHPHMAPPEFVQSARRLLSESHSELLPVILVTMHDQPLPVVNWLRSAGDDIVEHSVMQGDALPYQAMVDIAGNREFSEYPRRIALEWCERYRPGIRDDFLPQQLHDPVFASDAIDSALAVAQQREVTGNLTAACTLLNVAFAAVRDPVQAKTITDKLAALGETADLHRQLGIVSNWHALGPFSDEAAGLLESIVSSTPTVDLTRRYPGIDAEISWRDVAIPPRDLTVDLNEVLAATGGVTGYLATSIEVERERTVELCATTRHDVQVWLNGQRVLHAENGDRPARLDQARVWLDLLPGDNQVVVRVSRERSVPPVAGLSPWPFGLRLVDFDGRGLGLADSTSENRGTP